MRNNDVVQFLLVALLIVAIVVGIVWVAKAI